LSSIIFNVTPALPREKLLKRGGARGELDDRTSLCMSWLKKVLFNGKKQLKDLGRSTTWLLKCLNSPGESDVR
jgi:hypothetical protein